MTTGSKLVIPDTDVAELVTVLDKLWLPNLPTGGQGVTLGVERHEGLARSSPWNNKYSDAVATINALLKDIIGVENYRWSSVDIGKNTVLKPQTKVDHLGKTLTFLVGDFTGGRFRTVDNTCVLTEPNEILI